MTDKFENKFTLTMNGLDLASLGLDNAHILWPDCRITKLEGFIVKEGETISDAIERSTPEGCMLFPNYDMAHAARLNRPGYLFGIIKDAWYMLKRRPHVFFFKTHAGALIIFTIVISLFAYFNSLNLIFVAISVIVFFIMQILVGLIDTYIFSPIISLIKQALEKESE